MTDIYADYVNTWKLLLVHRRVGLVWCTEPNDQSY